MGSNDEQHAVLVRLADALRYASELTSISDGINGLHCVVIRDDGPPIDKTFDSVSELCAYINEVRLELNRIRTTDPSVTWYIRIFSGARWKMVKGERWKLVSPIGEVVEIEGVPPDVHEDGTLCDPPPAPQLTAASVRPSVPVPDGTSRRPVVLPGDESMDADDEPRITEE